MSRPAGTFLDKGAGAASRGAAFGAVTFPEAGGGGGGAAEVGFAATGGAASPDL